MSNLVITDLAVTQDLDAKALTEVVGGLRNPPFPFRLKCIYFGRGLVRRKICWLVRRWPGPLLRA